MSSCSLSSAVMTSVSDSGSPCEQIERWDFFCFFTAGRLSVLESLSEGLLRDLFPFGFLAVVLLLVFELFKDAFGFSLFIFSVLLAIANGVVSCMSKFKAISAGS